MIYCLLAETRVPGVDRRIGLCGARAAPSRRRRAHGSLRNGVVDSKSGKAPDANPALLHKQMLQLLSSLWVTRRSGTFARLGLADAMEDGAEEHAAIAAARGLAPDRVYRLLRALSTWGSSTSRRAGASRSRRSGACSARTRPTTPGPRRTSSTNTSPTCGRISTTRLPASAPPSKRSRGGRSSPGSASIRTRPGVSTA